MLDGLDAAAPRVLPFKPGQAVRDLLQRAVSGEIADAAGQTGRTLSGDVQRAVRSYAADPAAVAPAARTATDGVRTDSVALPAPRIPALAPKPAVAPTANADVTPRPQGPGETAVAGPGLAERGKAEQSDPKRKAEHGTAGRDNAEHPHAGPARPAGPHGHGAPAAGPRGPHRAGDQDAPGPGKPEGKAAHDVHDARLPAAPGEAPAAKPPAAKPLAVPAPAEKPAAPRSTPDTKSDARAAAAQPPKAEAPKDASAVEPAAEAKTAVETKPALDARPALRTEAAPPKAETKAAPPAPEVVKGAPEKTAPAKAPAAVSAAVKRYKAQ
ncbi:hypothetical protein ABZT49_01220 [Methylobacterium sp. EM32]|uniref:hypothetical protein n=1 Tax=Methylobacterium sp. EM32 TaxID=3163481 RepID=UPI0033A0F846